MDTLHKGDDDDDNNNVSFYSLFFIHSLLYLSTMFCFLCQFKLLIIIIIIIIIIIYVTANGLSPGGSGYNACTST